MSWRVASDRLVGCAAAQASTWSISSDGMVYTPVKILKSMYIGAPMAGTAWMGALGRLLGGIQAEAAKF